MRIFIWKQPPWSNYVVSETSFENSGWAGDRGFTEILTEMPSEAFRYFHEMNDRYKYAQGTLHNAFIDNLSKDYWKDWAPIPILKD